MSDYNTQIPPRSTGLPPTEPARSSISPVVFIVGGLVVAVGVLFWAMSDDGGVTTTPAATDTNISIDNTTALAADAVADPAPAAMDAAPAEPAPADPAPAEIAPADTAPATEPAPDAPAVPVEE